jgi:hypothetical protein
MRQPTRALNCPDMVACPFDCHWCALSACRADGCEMTGEPPLLTCTECGVLVIRTFAFGHCVECVPFEVRAAKEDR